jgi:murein L,D-transpeptidase YafK
MVPPLKNPACLGEAGSVGRKTTGPMFFRFARATFLMATVAAPLVVAGCKEHSQLVANPEQPLPAKVLKRMKSMGMQRNAPIMARIFKEEGKVEIWKRKESGRYGLIADYDICKMSGKLGPKFTEGDRQAPEGFYTVRPSQMNPNSDYHLAFNMGYPNAFDRAHGRSGSNLMVHGACSSSGCYSMTNEEITEIYAFGRDAFRGGQMDFQIQAFPFRMTAANMARYRNDPNYAFWTMLKEGYDHFEIAKVPPKVDVCEKRYVFNQIGGPDAVFNPTGACPAMTTAPAIETAYQSYQATYQTAFGAALGGSIAAPKPSIQGLQEARVVADWSRKRARGERISIEPPSMQADGTVVATSRMGRIDSTVGRKMAALEAAETEKKRVAEEKAAAKAAAKAAGDVETAAKRVAAEQTEADAAAPASAEAAANDAAQTDATSTGSTGFFGGLRRRIGGIFGG